MTTQWTTSAINAIQADYQRSADTHLIPLELPVYPGVSLYLKDESTHPTGWKMKGISANVWRCWTRRSSGWD